MALLGVGLAGGSQTGYASLVDLRTGRVVWFNNLASAASAACGSRNPLGKPSRPS